MSQLVVVIQCDIVTKRCSGYACMNTSSTVLILWLIIRPIRGFS